jgi:hypothetical protein
MSLRNVGTSKSKLRHSRTPWMWMYVPTQRPWPSTRLRMSKDNVRNTQTHKDTRCTQPYLPIRNDDTVAEAHVTNTCAVLRSDFSVCWQFYHGGTDQPVARAQHTDSRHGVLELAKTLKRIERENNSEIFSAVYLQRHALHYWFRSKTRKRTYNVTMRRTRVTNFFVEKNTHYILCASVVLVIQHVMRMRRIVLPSVVCLAIPYSTLSHTQHYFRKKKKVIEHKSVLISSTFLILSSIQRDTTNVKTNFMSSTSSQVLMKRELSRYFPEKKTQISNCIKIHTVGAELFNANRQTDRRSQAAFGDFANAP